MSIIHEIKRDWASGSGISCKTDAFTLHIDRPLPFLFIMKEIDNKQSRFVKSESAYLIIRKRSNELSSIIQWLAVAASESFGAFMVIEVTPLKHENHPIMLIETPRTPVSERTLDMLMQAFLELRFLRSSPKVKHVYDSYVLQEFFSQRFSQNYNVYRMRISYGQFFHNGTTYYPSLLRSFHYGFSRSIRQAIFAFIQNTSYNPSHYHALGPRSLDRRAWLVDKQLTYISESFDLLLEVTPTNVDHAWLEFRLHSSLKPPQFLYRPLPIDPWLLKKQLFSIQIDRINDPTLYRLFSGKLRELDRQITLLSDRNTPQFLYGSLQLYGAPKPKFVLLAKKLINDIPSSSQNTRSLSAQKAASMAQDHIKLYQRRHPEFNAKVVLRDDASGMMVSKNTLIISKSATFQRTRIAALLHHEIGTHILTYFNGTTQPFTQLYAGFAGYEEFQEGLAVMAEYLSGGLTPGRLRLLAGRVLAVDSMVKRKSFIETYKMLEDNGFPPRRAFTICMRAYRGGGLTKDAIYLRGLQSVLSHLKTSPIIDNLYIGKITPDALPIIRELQLRNVLTPPAILPLYLSDSEANKRLEKLKEGTTIPELVK